MDEKEEMALLLVLCVACLCFLYAIDIQQPLLFVGDVFDTSGEFAGVRIAILINSLLDTAKQLNEHAQIFRGIHQLSQ
jgi:hypothetical protein